MDLTTIQKIQDELDNCTDENELEYSARTMASIIKRYQTMALEATETKNKNDVNMDIINMPIEITEKELGDIYDIDGLKNVVKKLLQIEAKLEEHNKVTKKLRIQKEKFRTKVREYMTLNDYEELELAAGGYLTVKKMTRRLNVYTKKRIPIVLNDYFISKKGMNPEDAAKQTDEIISFFDENAIKNKTETETLRRTKK